MDRKANADPEELELGLQLLKDQRITAADWVRQLSRTRSSSIFRSIRFAGGAACFPATGASWFLLKNPSGSEFWTRATCGEKRGGKNGKCPADQRGGPASVDAREHAGGH